MDSSTSTVTIGKTIYTLDLTNSQGIETWDQMAPYTTAVSNFIECFSLPSFAFPEVYEFMVAQRDCKLEDNSSGNMVFDTSNAVSDNEEQALIRVIRALTKENKTFFQKKNA